MSNNVFQVIRGSLSGACGRVSAGLRLRRRWALVAAAAILPGLAAISAGPAFAERGRASFSEGTLLSDVGSPLRGPRYALDFFQGAPPPAGWIEALPSRGINALHVYAESIVFTDNVGDNTAGLDEIVARTAASDIYLVITIGGHPLPAPNDAWKFFALDFWSLYAPRYAGQRHVIFELQNEAWFACSTGCVAQPSPGDVLDFQVAAYQVARGAAPDTPILFFSYAFFHNGAGVLSDMAGIDQRLVAAGQPPIDRARAGVAFHGYSGAPVTESTLRQVTAQGFGVVETELQPCPSCQGVLEIPLVIAYETTRTSWFSFLPWNRLNDTFWNDVLDDAYVVWAADEGNWPGTSAPPTGSGVALFSPVNAGAYIRVDTGSGELVADAATVTAASRFEIRSLGRYVSLRSFINGKYVRRGPDDRLLADAFLPTAFEWVDLPDGKVTLQPRSNWRFVAADYNLPTPILVADRPLDNEPPILAAGWERFEVEVLPELGCGGLGHEAEDGDLSRAFKVRKEGDRTYIEVPDGTFDGPRAPDDALKASYCVTVPVDGAYRIVGQVRAPDFGADSFYVRIDGRPEYLWVPRPLETWTSDLVNDTRGASVIDPVEVYLAAGEHTLDILMREDGTQLDSFVLTPVQP